MLIDFSLRPPYKSLANMAVHSEASVRANAADMNMEPSDAALQHSTDLLVKEMDAAGIAHGVCHGRAKDGTLTQDLADLMKQYPGKFTGFPGIDLSNVANGIEETRVCLDELGFPGVMLEPGNSMPPIYPDDPGLYPIYEMCRQRGASVLYTISGQAGPDIGYANPVYVDRAARDFPTVNFIVRHAFWPYTLEACGAAKKRSNIYLCPDVYWGMPGYMHFVEAANTYLSDRLLFGTAFPVVPLAPMVEVFNRLPFRDGVREKIEYLNGARLLGLPA